MGMSREILMEHLTEAFPEAEIVLTDLAGDNDHWQAEIVTEAFETMNRLARQRSVYAALGELMTGPIHAFTCRTLTPTEDTENM